jgi:hypothetical protein
MDSPVVRNSRGFDETTRPPVLPALSVRPLLVLLALSVHPLPVLLALAVRPLQARPVLLVLAAHRRPLLPLGFPFHSLASCKP